MGWREPVNPGRGLVRVLGKVFGRSPCGGDQVDIAASGSLVAHQAADERDLLPIRRPAGHGNLQTVQRARRVFGVEHRPWLAAWQPLRIELSYPPVVFPGRGCGDVGQLGGVGCPVIFIDVQSRWGDLAEFTGSGFNSGHPLDLQPLDADHAGGRLHGRQRPGRPGGSFYI